MRRILGLCAVVAFGTAGCIQPHTNPLKTAQTIEANVVASEEVAADAPAMKPVATVPSDSQAILPVGKLVQATAKTATLKAKFVLDGAVPSPSKIDGSRDPFCADKEILTESMVVSDKGEISNVAVYLYTRRMKVELPDIPAAKQEHVLDNQNCAFVPHILAARPGQSILVKNSDQTGHNANFGFFANDGVNFLIPAGGEKSLELKAEEPAPIPVECNVHPWMKAYLIITDHPFVGISDAKGELTIENLPVGELTFKIWHENQDGSIDEAMVNGKKEELSLIHI